MRVRDRSVRTLSYPAGVASPGAFFVLQYSHATCSALWFPLFNSFDTLSAPTHSPVHVHVHVHVHHVHVVCAQFRIGDAKSGVSSPPHPPTPHATIAAQQLRRAPLCYQATTSAITSLRCSVRGLRMHVRITIMRQRKLPVASAAPWRALHEAHGGCVSRGASGPQRWHQQKRPPPRPNSRPRKR